MANLVETTVLSQPAVGRRWFVAGILELCAEVGDGVKG
jgi:hypothetical protein